MIKYARREKKRKKLRIFSMIFVNVRHCGEISASLATTFATTFNEISWVNREEKCQIDCKIYSHISFSLSQLNNLNKTINCLIYYEFSILFIYLSFFVLSFFRLCLNTSWNKEIKMDRCKWICAQENKLKWHLKQQIFIF